MSVVHTALCCHVLCVFWHIKQWQMCHQAKPLSLKEVNFLYSKTLTNLILYQSMWKEVHGYVTSAIQTPLCMYHYKSNHAPIGEYRQRIFPCEKSAFKNMNACPCSLAILETRDHILYKCNRFKEVIGDSLFNTVFGRKPWHILLSRIVFHR